MDKNHKLIIRILAILAVLLFAAILGRGRLPAPEEEKPETELPGNEGMLNVYYLELEGKASAVLAESNEKFMLIDGGSEETAEALLACLHSMGVERLEYILLSSYEDGRLAGAVRVMEDFEVSTILSPDYEADSAAYRDYRETVEQMELEEVHPNAGETYAFSNTFFTVTGPLEYVPGGAAENSLCIRLDFGDTSFLFCGDAGEEEQARMAEADLTDEEETLKADVCYISSARRSLAEEFLNCVRPDYVVLSRGEELSDTALALLEEREVRLYRIETEGHICAFSDGRTIVWESASEPSA